MFETLARKLAAPVRWLGWSAVVASLLLHAAIVFCFTDGRDALSAVAVFPIWLWALGGSLLAAVAMPLLRSRWPLAIIALWAISALIGADERRSLMRGLSPTLEVDRATPEPGRPRPIRVASLNCSGRNIDALQEVARFHPDIIFLQEAPSGGALQKLAKEMYGADGSSAGAWHCAIIARGKLTLRPTVLYQHGTGALLQLPDGTELEVMSVHLEHATTRWDLWRKSCWREHRDTHRERRDQLAKLLTGFSTAAAGKPRLFGGDFNAPPSSNLFESIPDDYTNTFGAAGRGLGNTFINRLPVLRIDHIYASPAFEVIDSRAWRTVHSDHRMLITDILLK